MEEVAKKLALKIAEVEFKNAILVTEIEALNAKIKELEEKLAEFEGKQTQTKKSE